MDSKWARKRIETVLAEIEDAKEAARKTAPGALVRPIGLGAALIFAAAGIGGCGDASVPLYGVPQTDAPITMEASVDDAQGDDGQSGDAGVAADASQDMSPQDDAQTDSGSDTGSEE